MEGKRTSGKTKSNFPSSVVAVMERCWQDKLATGNTALTNVEVKKIQNELGTEVISSAQIRGWFSRKRTIVRKAASQPPVLPFMPEPVVSSDKQHSASEVALNDNHQSVAQVSFDNRFHSVSVENDFERIIEGVFLHSILRQTDSSCWDFFVSSLYSTSEYKGSDQEEHAQTPRQRHAVLTNFGQRLLDLYISEFKAISTSADCPSAFTRSEFSMLQGPVRILWSQLLFSFAGDAEHLRVSQQDMLENRPPPLFKLAFIIHQAWYLHFVESVCSNKFTKDPRYDDRVQAIDRHERGKVFYVFGWIGHKLFRKGRVWKSCYEDIKALENAFVTSSPQQSGASTDDMMYTTTMSKGWLCYPKPAFFNFGLLLESFIFVHLKTQSLLDRPTLLDDILMASIQDDKLNAAFNASLPNTGIGNLESTDHLRNRCIELYIGARQRDFLCRVNSELRTNAEQTSLRSGLINRQQSL